MSSTTTTTPPEQEGAAPNEQLREKINVHRYDINAWNAIVNEAQSRPISEAAPLYEQLLATFPTAARIWKMYVEAQMAANNDDAVKQIFSRCLLNCLSVDLWRCYIRFMRKVNDNRGNEGREEMKKAYEFMLNHLGADIAAGPVWMEYIAFLKAAPASTPQEESQRMTAVRKAYQKAILTPIHMVEQLWKEYEGFENSVSRALAKGLLAEYQPKHFSARAVYRERKKHCERIDHSILATPPTGSIKEEQQGLVWKGLLNFEKGNPQRLDAGALTKRVAFTYEQCLMYLYHYPDIWYDYATWHAENNSFEAAVAVFGRALKALPDTSVLHYAYAEFEESRGSIEEAKKVYETLLQNDSTANALAYIQYMRFVRRTEGVEAARKVFLEARKSPACTFHVYVASATMELCIDKDPKVARNIFELGLKKYSHEPAYVLEYADFLCRMNDDRNVRVLFERALKVLPPEESIEVWNRFMAFEQAYGDLQSMLKVEQRRREALSQNGEDEINALESALQQLIARYRFLDLWPCSSSDLDHLARQQIIARQPPSKSEKQSVSTNTASSLPAEKAQPTVAAADGSALVGVSVNIVRPDISHMMVYDPRQGFGGMMNAGMPGMGLQMRPPAPPPGGLPPRLAGPPPLPPGRPPDVAMGVKVSDEVLKSLPSAVGNFLSRLPAVNGPIPDVDVVISVFLQAEVPSALESSLQQPQQTQRVPSPGNAGNVAAPADSAGSMKQTPGSNGTVRGGSHQTSSGAEGRTGGPGPRNQRHQQHKRKEPDRAEEEEDSPVSQSRPPPRDVFRLRQLQRARVVGNSALSGVASGGSGAYSGEPSGSSE
ncbi:hypothetical protein R1sor_020293 [Riccia sorocarpa]|uniref:Suppressor of forked domain-containing protein n=1 Tax=Riccia sorocarpa TaxID=122646 RepID=A0ABD3IG30_9MARC